MFISSCLDVLVEHRIQLPPVKVLRMPTTNSSTDSGKNAPPVARKPSKGKARSSILSIISNQSTSELKSTDTADTPKSPEESALPSQPIGNTDCRNVVAEKIKNDDIAATEDSNISFPPPPPDTDDTEQFYPADNSNEPDTSYMDFPPPPDDVQIQQALDRISSKYDTSQLAVSLKTDSTANLELPPPPSVDEPDRAETIGKVENVEEPAEVVRSQKSELEIKLATGSTDKKETLAHSTVEKIDVISDNTESIGSPMTEQTIDSSINLSASEDSLSTAEDMREDRGKLPVHSSFSVLDTDVTVKPGLSKIPDENKEELNHNNLKESSSTG